jgi:hypothetical protein
MNMKPPIRFIIFFIILILIASACSSPASTATPAQSVPPTETTAPTETSAPTVTATPEPSFTPTPALLPLEILEWSEWPYGNPADPSNTDTHVEVLIRNPNDVPVRVNRDLQELRFINAAGEVVYTNNASFLYIWQGEWMLPGETAALSACVCFDTQGLEKQEWESLEWFAPLEVATDIAYTHDVEVVLGQIVDIAAAHLGGSGFALETTFNNTGDQALESVPHRVLAWDASGRYIGVAFAGNAVASWTENIAIQPGDTATGLNVIDIDYIDESSLPTLTYEVAAIGIPYQPAAATAEVALPSGTPLADWNGIPIMPGALAGEVVDDSGYQFTTTANLAEIAAFYETELTNLGFEVESTVDETVGQAVVNFQKEGTSGMVLIAQIGGGLHGVGIFINP